MKQMLPDPVGHLSEFVGGYNGDCMETALYVCLGAATGTAVTEGGQIAINEEMAHLGWALPNGATSINRCIDYVKYKQYLTITEIPYWEPFGGDAQKLLEDHAGVHPILLNVANGQALKDSETHAADEAGLHYHGIAIVGKQDDGYICADGDNWQAPERFQVYPWPVIWAAKPCGALVLAMRRPVARSYTVQPGDFLWSIVHHLIALGVVPATYSAAQLYAMNEGVIGHNPNLILPGEVLHY